MRFLRAMLSVVLIVGLCVPAFAWADDTERIHDVSSTALKDNAKGGGGEVDSLNQGSRVADSGELPSANDLVSGSDDSATGVEGDNSSTAPDGSIESDAPSVSEPDASEPDTPETVVPEPDAPQEDDSEIVEGVIPEEGLTSGKEDEVVPTPDDAPEAELEKSEDLATEEAGEKEARTLLGKQKAANLPGVATIASALNSSQVFDIPSASTSDSVGLQLYADNTTPAQRFQLKARTDGFYTIVNVNSGKVLDVRNASTQAGAVVQQYASNNTDAQAWKLVPTGDADNSYYLASKLKDTLVVDVRGGAAKNGALLQLSVAGGAKSQKFLVQGVQAALSNGTYILGTRATKTVLDVSAANAGNYANIQMYAKNGTPAQNFTLKYDASTGYYTISTFASGKVLDVAGASSSWGTNVHQYASNGTLAQKWSIEKTSDGKGYNILSACGGLALDVASASGANGANVQVYGRNGTNAQAWTIETLPAVKLDGLFTLRASANNNYAVDIAAGSTANGANVQLYAYNGTWAQKFQIKMHDEQYCVIYSLSSGKVLDVARGGSNVQQYEFNGSAAQLWRPVSYGGEVYGFQSKENGRFLDVSSGSMSNGANIQVWEGNGSAAQRFKLSKTDRSTSVTEGSYVVKNVSSGSVLDMVGAGSANGTRAQLYAANNSYAQKFKILSAGADSYYFVNVHSSKYLDVDTGTKSMLQQWDRGESVNQKWQFYPVEGNSGAYYIKSLYTNSYLTNAGGALKLSAYEGGKAQQFVLERTTAFKVYLDAGHGYNSAGNGALDPGAGALGYRESDLTTDLVNRIAKQLDKQGIEYYVGYGKNYWTRHQDAVNMGCSTFLSIHFNSGGGHGTESFIHSYNAAAGSPTFQNVIHPYLLKGTGLFNRGVKRDEFAVCGGRLPSVLAEIAFINIATDMNKYMGRKDTVAAQLALGLKQASQNSACGWY